MDAKAFQISQLQLEYVFLDMGKRKSRLFCYMGAATELTLDR